MTAAVLTVTLWQSVVGIFCFVRDDIEAMKLGFYDMLSIKKNKPTAFY